MNRYRSKLSYGLRLFGLALLIASWCGLARAQTSTHYLYDENGRLIAVIAPNGEAGVYEYDPAGNITAIRRLTNDTLEIIDFAPRQGVPGNRVRIFDVGFGGVGSAPNVSAVSFNGTAARIIEQAPNVVTVEVPESVTTGPVSLTVAGNTARSARPFTVAGIIVVPPMLTLLPSQSFQFTARIPGSDDQRARWFVNDTPGGSNQTGTITADGLYVAPNIPAPILIVTVSAESLAQPGLTGESQVTVKDVFQANADAVSVRYGNPPNSAAAFAARAEGVSVRYGNAPNTAASFAAITEAVSVRYGLPPATGTAYAPLAEAVSVRYGNAPSTASAYTPLAESVSVRYGAATGTTAQTPTISSISVTNGPVINSLAPLTLTRGTSATITLTGSNLNGASALRFFNADGTATTGLTATNISANANGTAVTATLTIAANAVVGPSILVLTTPAGRSQTSNLGTNVLTITQ